MTRTHAWCELIIEKEGKKLFSFGSVDLCVCGHLENGECDDPMNKSINIGGEYINYDKIKSKFGDGCKLKLYLHKG